MKSVKPGRGPSMMGGFAGIVVALFGVFWTIMAVSMDAPFFFPIFGILFTCLAIAQCIYNFKNATSKNRHSEFDIVDSCEEPDPWDPMRPARPDSVGQLSSGELNYCPYCGAPVDSSFAFCGKCGKKLPE